MNKPNTRNRFIDPVREILTGRFLVSDPWAKNWPFILYLSLLALIMIASSHSADRKVHEIARLRTQMKELNSEHIDLRSRLMIESMEYKVVQRGRELGLEKSEQPPIIIKTQSDH